MNRKYTAADICRAIDALDKNRLYGYVRTSTHGEIRIVQVVRPDGPIEIQRRDVGGVFGEVDKLSVPMLWRAANALNTRLPINLDRVFAGSYNTRSVLEALLAHTPEIYTCHPGRQESIGDSVKIKPGHKHIILKDDQPHAIGQIVELPLGEDFVISEIPTLETSYDIVPSRREEGIDVAIARRHSQIQVCLAEIAKALNMRTWLAVEDHGIKYNGKVITEYPFIVKNLNDERTLAAFPEAISVANHIDCMFFNGGLPYAFEVEHTTGVTSGLNRMLSFKNKAEHLNTRYVIVAPDEDRELVMTRAQPAQFEPIEPFYLSYSKVEDLYAFIHRYDGKLLGTNKEFLSTFMERCRAA